MWAVVKNSFPSFSFTVSDLPGSLSHDELAVPSLATRGNRFDDLGSSRYER
jgi:hypothetical protein